MIGKGKSDQFKMTNPSLASLNRLKTGLNSIVSRYVVYVIR
jgi:hypothetical protein